MNDSYNLFGFYLSRKTKKENKIEEETVTQDIITFPENRKKEK